MSANKFTDLVTWWDDPDTYTVQLYQYPDMEEPFSRPKRSPWRNSWIYAMMGGFLVITVMIAKKRYI
jgi:hypothetical protein